MSKKNGVQHRAEKAPVENPQIAAVDQDEDSLPVVESVGLVQTGKGWTVVFMRSQGLRIIETDVVSGPDSRMVAMERTKVAVMQKLLTPRH